MVQKAGVLHILTYECASRHSGVAFLDITPSKSGPNPSVFLTFWLQNVLRATAACHFSTSQLPKWLLQPQFFNILTWKCASRYRRVPFFNIATSKMAPRMWCFTHFDFQMCFAPQPRAIFQHRNFQNGSYNLSFLTFWLENVLRATGACHFSTSQLPKWLRECGVLRILTFKCASRHSRVPFFTCPLNSYLRTRRFSEPTFGTSGSTIHWENTAIRGFTNIFRACTFFLVTRHASWSPFCWLDICTLLATSTLLFNSAYSRKLDF